MNTFQTRQQELDSFLDSIEAHKIQEYASYEPRTCPRGSDTETAILLILIERSQAGELGRDNFGRHLSVQRYGARWLIGDHERCGGPEYLLTDRQAAAVALGRVRIEKSGEFLGEVRWPTMQDRKRKTA